MCEGGSGTPSSESKSHTFSFLFTNNPCFHFHKKYIHDNDELYMLFAGDSRSDPNSYHSVWDEFHKPNLFEFDIEELLSKIQKKINGQEKD